MKVTVLASGSKGNCTLLQTNNLNILIDAGISCKELEHRLNKDNIKIDIIFITHSHIDHINGLKTIYKKYKPIVYTKNKELIEKDICETNILEESITIDNLTINYFPLSHDNDCIGYSFKESDKELIYITDTGYINKKILTNIVNKSMYIIESNHDVELLRNGKYPFFLQQRILNDEGHLSNKDCCRYLSKIIGNNTSCVVLAHLSEQNNTEQKVQEEIDNMLLKNNIHLDKVYIAKQHESLDEIEV